MLSLNLFPQRQPHNLKYNHNDELFDQSDAEEDRDVASENVVSRVCGEGAEAGVDEADCEEWASDSDG